MKIVQDLYTWKSVDFFGVTISVPLETRLVTCDAHGFVAALFPNYKDKECYHTNNIEKHPWRDDCTWYVPDSGDWHHKCDVVDSVLIAIVQLDEDEDPSTLRLDLAGIEDHV